MRVFLRHHELDVVVMLQCEIPGPNVQYLNTTTHTDMFGIRQFSSLFTNYTYKH